MGDGSENDATEVGSSAEDLLLWRPPDPDTRVVVLLDPYLNFERTDELKPRLKALLARELDGGARCIILDLARTGVIDSCGLAVLVSMERQLTEGGARLVLCGLSDLLLRLLELTRLDRVFEIRDNVDVALAEGPGGIDR